MVRDWRFRAKKITAASAIVPCEINMLGSTAKGVEVGASDIDLLIFYGQLPRRNKEREEPKAKIEERSSYPFTIPSRSK